MYLNNEYIIQLCFYYFIRNFSVNALNKVSEREFQVYLTPERMLYHYFPVFFDYYHLCGIEMIIYAALTNISPCIIE